MEHCLNCPVYHSSGRTLLDRPPPEGYTKEWTEVFRHAVVEEYQKSTPVFAFRIEAEWLALPMSAVIEITERKSIHTLPHRSNNVLLGITNVRGELHIAVSLSALLGLERLSDVKPMQSINYRQYPRALVFGHEGEDFVTPVDEVFGVVQYNAKQLAPNPVTLTKTLAAFTRGIFEYKERPMGLLDEELLVLSLQKNYL